jgi:hypothetical protein
MSFAIARADPLGENPPRRTIRDTPPMSNTLEQALVLAKGPFSRLALKYSFVMRDLVVQCKEPGFTAADWAPLAALVATDEFERIGNFREKVTWDQYSDLLTIWGKSTAWDFTVRRVTEGDRYAILELEEYATYPDRKETYGSVSTYEFNLSNKLRHLEIYLSKTEPIGSAQSHQWDLEEVSVQII